MNNFVFHLRSRSNFATASISEYQPLLRFIEQNLASASNAKFSIVVSGAWLVDAKKFNPVLIQRLYQLGRSERVQIIMSRRDIPPVDVLTAHSVRMQQAKAAPPPSATKPTARIHPSPSDDDIFYVKVHRLEQATEIPDSDTTVLPSDDWDDLVWPESAPDKADALDETDELDEAAMAIQILAQRLTRQKASLEHQVDDLLEGEII